MRILRDRGDTGTYLYGGPAVDAPMVPPMAHTLTANELGGARRWQEIVDAPALLHHPSRAAVAHIPGRLGLPLIGVMPEILRDPLGFSRRMSAAHGRVYRFHAFGHWHLHVTGPEANETVLFDDSGIFSAREGWGQLIAPLFPGALLIKDGPEHRADRRLMGEAFRQAQLTGYQAIAARDAAASIQAWQGQRIEVYPEIRKLTFRIAASTFLGAPLDEEAAVAITALRQMIASLLAMVKSPMPSLVRMRGRIARTRLEAILTRLIAEKRAAPGSDFLSRMANLPGEDGAPLPVSRICESFAFLLSAAHDTLASSLTSLLYQLAANPDWAQALRDELDSAGIVDPLDAATAQLPLFDMVYKESLRLNGPAPLVWRRAARAFTIEGIRVPAGMMVGANLMMSHRLPDLWPDPERFDPYRFTAEAEKARGRFAFIPFGAGVHKCIGMHFAQQQARIFAAMLLRASDLGLADDRPVRWYQWPNARPRTPFHVTLDRRCRGR
jgi:cytochrome P450